MFRVTAVYPNSAGSRFDGDYYAGAHTALARRLLEPHGLRGIRANAGVAALPDGAPPFWMIAEMLFDSAEGFAAGMAAAGEALFADTPNYTDATPILFASHVAGDGPTS